MNPSVNNNHHGQALKAFVKTTLGMSIVEFGEEYLPGKSRAAVFALFRKAKFSLPEISLFCQYFDLSPTFFDQPRDVFVTPYNRTSRGSMAAFVSLNAYAKNKTGFWGFVNTYYSTLIKYMQEAEKYVMVYVYLGKVRGIPFPGLQEKIRDYYEAIEEKINKDTPEGFNYTLIMARPIESAATRAEPFETTVKRTIEYLFFETFAHVARSFLNYERKFYLYAIPSPSRLYSYHLLDDKYVISEYDKLDKDGVASSNMLFVNQIRKEVADDPVRILHGDYLKEVTDIKNEAATFSKTKITKDSFVSAIYSLDGEVSKEIKKLIHQHEEKSKEFNQLGAENNGSQINEKKNVILKEMNKVTDQIRAKKRLLSDIKKKIEYWEDEREKKTIEENKSQGDK